MNGTSHPTPSLNVEIANTILAQLGSRTLSMLGVKGTRAIENGVRFGIKGCKAINVIEIALRPDDTYEMRFIKRTGGRWSSKKCETSPIKLKDVSTHDGVYVDSIHDVIYNATGLATSL